MPTTVKETLNPFEKIVAENQKYCMTHKAEITRLLANNDSFLEKEFNKAQGRYDSSIYCKPLIIKSWKPNGKYNLFFFTPYSCYAVLNDKDDSVVCMYQYKRHTIKQIHLILHTLVREGYLPEKVMMFANALYLKR